MSAVAGNPTPSLGVVLREQIRAVLLANGRVALAVGALFLFFIYLLIDEVLMDGGRMGFHPERWVLPGFAGLLLPFAIWRGEERRGGGFFWGLPVDRRRHAVLRVLAGWLWLMAAVALFVLVLLVFSLLSGGPILGDETVRLLTKPFDTPGGPLPENGVADVSLRLTPVLWVVPFTSATGSYLIVSGLALGLRHPLRWIAGAAGLLLLTSGVGDLTDSRWIALAPARLIEGLMNGRWGWDTLITARTESLKTEGLLPSGEPAVVWRALPDLGDWGIATALWLAAGLLLVWLAASRHREGRRPGR